MKRKLVIEWVAALLIAFPLAFTLTVGGFATYRSLGCNGSIIIVQYTKWMCVPMKEVDDE